MRPTLPDVLRSMSTNTPMTTHSESCWQWHRSCAGLLAADMIEDLVDGNEVMHTALVNIIPFLDQVAANRSDLNPYCEKAWGHLNAAKDAIA